MFPVRKFLTRLPAFLCVAWGALSTPLHASPAGPRFKAGTAVVDIAPQSFPVRVNAMFTERSATKVVDPLTARALALDDGTNRLVFCVVDTCMMPRDLINLAKREASAACGLPIDRMLVSATHTHSAPSAMGCLGSRVDPDYARFLPSRIATAITQAVTHLEPARIGWTHYADWEHTFNRRWIRRPDRLLPDPFGIPNVRANMHPGYLSPDAIGPSGPVDPWVTVLAVQTMDGRPLSVLANYSMHYVGSDLLSSDYFGRFNQQLGIRLKAGGRFVGIMSQGTSGDLACMDYGAAKQDIVYDAYAGAMADRVVSAYHRIPWKEWVPLAMLETRLPLAYRAPGPERLAWARDVVAKLGGRLPQTYAEIYAWEAIYLHEKPRMELLLQAVRVGDLGISALPNEVYALTGLKLKSQSPFPVQMNIELANGAEGYIPPVEQHVLGGYTTWPARTAGLETAAESRIVESSLKLLEGVAGRPRRTPQTMETDFTRAVRASSPEAFWRFEEMDIPLVHDERGHHNAWVEPGVALHLPGMDQDQRGPDARSRAFHFAGGRVQARVPTGSSYTLEGWFWNGLRADARPITATLFEFEDGERLGIGGVANPEGTGRLFLAHRGTTSLGLGRSPLALRTWYHVAVVHSGRQVRLYLDGRLESDVQTGDSSPSGLPDQRLWLGGGADHQSGLEGKLDDVAFYRRALGESELLRHARARSSALARPLATP